MYSPDGLTIGWYGRGNATAVPRRDSGHTRLLDTRRTLTLCVSCCPDLAQSSVSVTLRSRHCGKYRTSTRHGMPIRVTGSTHHVQPIMGPRFWRPATRSSWIPPVPEDRLAPDLRKTNPAAATLRGFLFARAGQTGRVARRRSGIQRMAWRTKGDGTPRGAVWLPFTVRDRTPVRSTSARRAQRLPMKVLLDQSRKCASHHAKDDGATQALP